MTTNEEIIEEYIFSNQTTGEHFEELRENMLRALEERDNLSRANERHLNIKKLKDYFESHQNNGTLNWWRQGYVDAIYVLEGTYDNIKLPNINYREGINKITQEAKAEGYKEGQKDTAKQIFKELDNLHIVENWSTQKGKGIPLLLKQIDAYNAVKKRFKVD